MTLYANASGSLSLFGGSLRNDPTCGCCEESGSDLCQCSGFAGARMRVWMRNWVCDWHRTYSIVQPPVIGAANAVAFDNPDSLAQYESFFNGGTYDENAFYHYKSAFGGGTCNKDSIVSCPQLLGYKSNLNLSQLVGLVTFTPLADGTGEMRMTSRDPRTLGASDVTSYWRGPITGCNGVIRLDYSSGSTLQFSELTGMPLGQTAGSTSLSVQSMGFLAWDVSASVIYLQPEYAPWAADLGWTNTDMDIYPTWSSATDWPDTVSVSFSAGSLGSMTLDRTSGQTVVCADTDSEYYDRGVTATYHKVVSGTEYFLTFTGAKITETTFGTRAVFGPGPPTALTKPWTAPIDLNEWVGEVLLGPAAPWGNVTITGMA